MTPKLPVVTATTFCPLPLGRATIAATDTAVWESRLGDHRQQPRDRRQAGETVLARRPFGAIRRPWSGPVAPLRWSRRYRTTFCLSSDVLVDRVDHLDQAVRVGRLNVLAGVLLFGCQPAVTSVD